MLGEEEVWEVESSRELVPLGWIHTHPTQVSATAHGCCDFLPLPDPYAGACLVWHTAC